jgi:hypothetical protein
MVIDEPAYAWMHLIRVFLENNPPSDDNPSDDNAKVERISRKSK